MSRRQRLELALWGLALVAATLGFQGWTRALPSHATTAAESRAAPPGPQPFAGEALAAAAVVTAEKNPFRLDRRPPDLTYQPESEGVPMPLSEQPPPFRPPLALAGVLGGPPWEAVIEGVPGREAGVLVRRGDELGELRVTTVGPERVVIRGADTTWVLTLKRPWQ